MPPRPVRLAAPESDPSTGDGDTSVDIDLSPPGLPSLSPSGASVTDQSDGTSEYDFDAAPHSVAIAADPNDPDANLALHMDESDLDAIAAELLDKIDEDKESSRAWYETVATGIEMLGMTYEERTYPFKGASGAYDPMMAEAVFRCYAKARGELLPAAGPVKTQVIGAETDAALDQAARVKAWMNLYLTKLAPEYYPEFDQMLWWWSLAGSMFKKVYQDPILGRPVAPFIMPQDFIVAYGTKSLDSCVRATHECTLSQREVKLRQLSGLWLDTDLGEPDEGAGDYIGSASSENPIREASDNAEGVSGALALGSRSKYLGDAAWQIPESHVDMDLSSLSNSPDPLVPEGLPVPYRVTLARQSRKILAIHRNWRVGDEMYSKRNWFIHYKLLPGTGFYGFGFAHVLNNSARTGTALTRQIIDSATLGMFSGGVRAKGMKIENNNLMIGPCEFPEIDTGGQPLSQVFQPLPVRDLNPVTLDLLKFNSDRSENLANTMDISVGDGRQDAPVGTTVALMEAANVVTSVMIKNAHVSLRREFEAIGALFGEHLPATPYPFPVRPSAKNPSGQAAIMKADFGPSVEVVPVSDPNITSSSQRMMRAEAIAAKGNQYPDLVNRREMLRESFEAMNLDDDKIDKLVPPPQQGQPADPLTENQMALAGAPLAAAPWQAHEAHIAVHQTLAQMPAMQAHIAQHVSMQMRAKIEAVIGRPLPQGQLPPELENQVALMTAKAMDQLKKQQGNTITQDQIVQQEFQLESAKIAEKAQAVQTKATSDAFKANLTFQSEERDRAVRLRIAEINAASGLADNQVPDPAYVKAIMGIGNEQPFGPTPTPVAVPVPIPVAQPHIVPVPVQAAPQPAPGATPPMPDPTAGQS